MQAVTNMAFSAEKRVFLMERYHKNTSNWERYIDIVHALLPHLVEEEITET
jgi:hypothetical protein